MWKATTQLGCAVASCNGIFPASYGVSDILFPSLGGPDYYAISPLRTTFVNTSCRATLLENSREYIVSVDRELAIDESKIGKTFNRSIN